MMSYFIRCNMCISCVINSYYRLRKVCTPYRIYRRNLGYKAPRKRVTNPLIRFLSTIERIFQSLGSEETCESEPEPP